MIRVAVIDDEVLVRSAFELILGAAGGIEVVASTDGPGALDAIVATHPDVVLLDIRMPGRTGLEVLDDIRELAEPPVVAILTTFDTDDSILHALSRGAAGFLLKDTDPEQLPALVRSLASGGVVLSPAVSRVVVSGYVTATSRPAPPALETLTERERLVLARLAVGESNAEIGRALHLSASTVKDHVSAILAKLDLTTRLQAAIIADRATRHRVDAG